MNKNKTIELTNDYIFKRVFSKKGNEDLLIDLLESILEIKIEKIEVIEEAEIDRININDKVGVIDLKATINNNTIVDIEIQLRDQHNMIMRSMFYTAGLYHNSDIAWEREEARKQGLNEGRKIGRKKENYKRDAKKRIYRRNNYRNNKD